MRKNLAIAGAIVAGLSVAGGGHLKPAFAGHWEEVPNPYIDQYGQVPWPGDPDYPSYVAEEAKRLDGRRTFSGSDYWDGSPHAIESTRDWSEGDWGVGEYTTTFSVFGGPITVDTWGKFTTIFRWVPDDQNDSPKPLHLKGNFLAEGHVSSGDPWRRDGTKEWLTLSIANEDGIVTDTGTGLQSILYKKVHVNVPLTSGSINPDTGYFEVKAPWTNVDVQAHSEYNGATTEITGDVGFHYYYDIDTRSVEIASTAEPSYYKDVNGDRQAHTHDANGQLTVDTVATWHTAGGGINIDTWVWDGTFNAVLLGSPWGAPEYEWTATPAGLNQTVSTFPAMLNLGKTTTGTKNDSLTTNTAQVNLKVTDDDGRQLLNTYHMIFHKPFENPVHQAGQDVDCGTSGSNCTNDMFEPSTSTYLAAGESLTYALTPPKYDFGATLDNIAVAVDTAATVGTLLTAGEVSTPKWVTALEIMKVATSVTSLAVGSPAPDLHPQYTGSYDDFKDAVNDQLSVGNYDDNKKRVILPLGYTDALLMDIQSSFAGTTASTNPFWNGITNSQNPNGIKVSFTIYPHRKKQKRLYKGDVYNHNGYVGQETQPLYVPIVVQVEPQFKLDE